MNDVIQERRIMREELPDGFTIRNDPLNVLALLFFVSRFLDGAGQRQVMFEVEEEK